MSPFVDRGSAKTRSMTRLWLVILLVGCHDDRPRDSKPGAGAPVAAKERSRVVVLPKSGDFDQLVADAAAVARRDGYTPFLALTADWCPPCKAFEKYRRDPAMADALAGTAVIQADFDHWGEAAAKLGVSAIPAWMVIDDQGHAVPGKRVDGGAWSEDVPANMAPVLDRFFHGQPTGP